MKVNKDCQICWGDGEMKVVLDIGEYHPDHGGAPPHVEFVPCDCVKNDSDMRTVNEDWHYLDELDGFYG